MQATEIQWSATEQQIAKTAFDSAYVRETSHLLDLIRVQAPKIEGLEDLWKLHDFLSARRHEIDGKYDYRYSTLIFVFAGLMREGWLTSVDLDGLAPEKLAKITALSRM
jgi:Photoprotection regulator fluorescence recovery protein